MEFNVPKARETVVLLGFLLLAIGTGEAQDLEIASHPDPRIVALYEANEAEVGALRSRVADSADPDDRASAFEEIVLRFPLAAEITARQYVTDESERIALMAIQVLKGATVMSDHMMPFTGQALSPRVTYMLEKHARSREALRPAVSDSRPRVRREAVGFLASLSDEATLKSITADEANLYSDVESANLYTLADAESGQRYLERFIGYGSIDAQRTAVGYLGAIPSYQDKIRIECFLNPDAPVEVRVEAAHALSVYDSEFPEYALDVTSEAEVDPRLFETTLGGYVNVQANRGRLDPGSATIISNRIDRYIDETEAIPDDVSRNIKALNQRLSAIASK